MKHNGISITDYQLYLFNGEPTITAIRCWALTQLTAAVPLVPVLLSGLPMPVSQCGW